MIIMGLGLTMRQWLGKLENNPSILWGIVAFIVILGVFLHLYANWNWGVGVSHDSIFYISAAENFLAGEGLNWIDAGNVDKPLTHFPPLYPVSLSVLGFLTGVREAVDWGGALLFGINVGLVALIVYLGTKSNLISCLSGLLALISPIFLDVHFEAMSEPLYLTYTLSSFILLVIYLRCPKSWLLTLAAVVASCAFLTRYVGVSVVLTGAIVVFFLYPGSYKDKTRKTFFYGLIAFIPNTLWYLRNYLLTGSLTNRAFSFHPITKTKLSEGVLSISEWVFPETIPVGFRLSIIFVIALIIVIGQITMYLHLKNTEKQDEVNQQNPILVLLVLHVCVYVGLLFLSLTFFDISTRLNHRILIPLYVVTLILGMISIQRMMSLIKIPLRNTLYLISAALFAVIMITYAFRSWEVVGVNRKEGRGYTSSAWQRSEIIALLNRLEKDTVVYSNEAFAIYYLSGISAYGIPEKFDPVKAEIRDDFWLMMDTMRETLKMPNSALVVFHQGYLRDGMPIFDEIVEGFVLAHESRDGVVFVDPVNLGYWDIE